MYSTNFFSTYTFFLIAFYQISENDAILINHRSFFQSKDSPQLHHVCFSKINSLIAETMKKQFCEKNIFINKLLDLIIIDSFLKTGNVKVVENFYLKK